MESLRNIPEQIFGLLGHLGTLNLLRCDGLCIRNEFMTKDILSNCQVDGIVREPGISIP